MRTPIAISRRRDGVIVDVNEAWTQATGIPRERAVGRPGAAAGHWSDLEARARIVARVDATGRADDEMVRFVRPDGAVRDVLVSCQRVDWDGEPHLLWSSRDVTELQRAHAATRQSDAKFAALFETNPLGMIVTRPRDRVVVEINDAALRMAGLEREEAIGARTVDLVRLLNLPDVDALRERAIQGERVSGSVQFERRDGRRVEALMSGAVIDLGGVPHFVISLLDVTEQRRVERERQQAEHKFAALFEDSPEPISLFRISDGVRLEANSAWERVTGHSRHGAAGRPAMQMTMFRDPAERAALIARVAAEGRVSNEAQKLRRADGSEFDALISASCIEIDGEQCVLWNWRDVSEQVRAERERHELDARYRALFESTLDGIVIGTPQNTLIDANPAALAMTGYAREELAGVHVSKLFRPDELAARPLRRDLGQRWSVVERTLARKDGGTLEVEVIAGPMPDGNVLAVMRDITERKRNEVALQKSERRYRMLFDFARDLVIIRAPDGTVISANPAACAALGYDCEELVGQPVTRFFDAEELKTKPLRTQELLERPDTAPVQRMLRRKDGSVLYVENLGGALPDGNLIVAMRDVTERVRGEQQLRELNISLERRVQERTAELEHANHDLESYNFSISHDLRQPLNAIAGFAELLRDQGGELAAGLAGECLDEIEQNAARMEQMIDALLRLSRAGRGALSKAPIGMRALVESVVHDLSAAVPSTAQVAIGLLPDAAGEAVLVRQIWANLIGNALKYSQDRESARIEISGARGDGHVEYVVRDNGIGFDMRDALRIFDPFQRLPSGKAFEGSGVGLAIVQRIVRRHGGTISAVSAPGEGATFRFSLPD